MLFLRFVRSCSASHLNFANIRSFSLSFFYCSILFTVSLAFAEGDKTETPFSENKSVPLQASDFYPHKITTDDFNETWSYQFTLDNGTKAFVNIASLQIPMQGRKIGCDLSFFNFKGKSYSVGRQYPKERLQAQKDRKRITIKDEYFMENLPGKGHRLFFSAHKNGDFLLDLTFESAVQGMRPEQAETKLGQNTYALFLHIPYGRVSGIIAYNSDTLHVKGYGTMDHSWQTAQANDIAERLISFSTNSSQEALSAKIGFDKNGKFFGYAVAVHSGKSYILKPLSILENGKPYSGKKFAKGTLTIQWDNQTKTEFSVTKTQQKFSMLNNFDGWIAKKAAKVLMGGEYFFYRGHSKNANGKFIDWGIAGL